MANNQNVLSQIVRAVIGALASRSSRSSDGGGGRPRATLRPQPPRAPQQAPQQNGRTDLPSPGQEKGSETVRIDPERIDDLVIEYAPDRDGDPDAGEIVWTWVPYEENDGRGKDRPVLVIGRQSSTRVFAVRMTSKAHEHDRDYLSIGSGAWDSKGRESWVDIEQLYSVHEDGMRREAAPLPRERYDRVAQALIARYRWSRRS